jgi:hypothetical protein
VNRDEIEQYDTVSAVFAPQRTDDLVPAAVAMIGQRFTFTADWTIDDDYPYMGDWHMSLCEDDWRRTGVMWVPLCDLTDLQLEWRVT